MTTYTRTCRCGAAFEAQDHRVKWCLACRTAKADAKAAIEAARPMKVCARCGKQEQIKRRHAWCLACREEDNAARIEQERAERRERRRREYLERIGEQEEQSRGELTRKERRERYLEEYAKLPPHEQNIHVAILLASILRMLVKTIEDQDQEEAPPANPEDIAHADQNDIDREFGDLMEGLDL